MSAKLVFFTKQMPARGKKSKLASKIEKADEKRKQKGESSKDFGQAGAPFHSGELPSQFSAEQNALERVGRKQRRTNW